MTTSAPSSTEYVVNEPRFDLPRAAPEQYRAMFAVSQSIRLDERLAALIDIRVSQLNGCAYCLDMHHGRARRIGETQQRLDTLAGWRESPFFTARERAALGLADAITRLATETPVPDAVYDEAARHFDEDELPQLVFAISVINSWNRLTVTAGTVAPAR